MSVFHPTETEHRAEGTNQFKTETLYFELFSFKSRIIARKCLNWFCFVLFCFFGGEGGGLLVNLRTRTGEEKRRQSLCDKGGNNLVWKDFPPNITFLLPNRSFCKRPENINAKHTINSPVTFLRHKRFAVLLFLPYVLLRKLTIRLI